MTALEKTKKPRKGIASKATDEYKINFLKGMLNHLRVMARSNKMSDQIYMQAFLDSFIEILMENRVPLKKAHALIEAAYAAYEE